MEGWGTLGASHTWATQNPGAPKPEIKIKLKPLPGPFKEWGFLPQGQGATNDYATP